MFYPEVTVAQLCSLYIANSDPVKIWDSEKEETVYEGTFEGAEYSGYAHAPVHMFGIGYSEFDPQSEIICIYI